ncbi:MAG TPA: CbtB domain-containing protein [Stellaceae bacterium]|nr:CbtB domain-containing protein [Stellaceae bacterium]
MTNSTTRALAPEATRGLAAALPGIFAIVIGAFLVLGAGFSPIAAIHNATHDARHTFFPCH